jgi:hypothetical protein
MAERFGASSLTALLAIAGMVGIGMVGYRAFSGTAGCGDDVEVCPLLGDSCSMSACSDKPKSCCPSDALAECDELAECDAEKTCSSASACKQLENGCTGDGAGECCGACGEGTNGEEKAACEEKVGCAEKAATCAEKAATCAEKAAMCAEKAATCSEKVAEAPKGCCSAKN